MSSVDAASVSAKLKASSVATLCTVLMKRGINRVFMYGVDPLPGSTPRLAGRAFTMRSVAVREDKLREDSQENPRNNVHRKAVEGCGIGEVLVIDCRGDGSGASGGMLLFERMRVRGCAGVVTDGGVRDAYEIATTGFPVYAKSVCPPNSMIAHRFMELNVPVTCGGVAVYPGDFIVGDQDGVIVVPAELAEEVANEALEYEDREAFILRKIREGAPIYGTYPLESSALEEYLAQKQGREPAALPDHATASKSGSVA